MAPEVEVELLLLLAVVRICFASAGVFSKNGHR